MATKAQQFFDANYPASVLGTVGKLQVSAVDDDVTVSVSGSVPTTFMSLANIDHIDLGTTTTITKKQRNIELVLVLDTTGSMGQGGKLAAMQSAAKKLVSTLFNGKSTSDTVKIGVVPFAAAVNIGSDKLNSGWLDKATYSASNATSHPLAFEDLDKTNGVSALTLYTKVDRTWSGCVRERSGSSAYELTDAAPSASTAASLWVPYFAPDEPDKASNTSYANTYLCDNPNKCSNGNSTTAPSATCVTGTTTNDQRQCYTNKYKSFSGTSTGPDFNCPPAPITAMTNTASTVNAAIDALVAKGSTVIPAGLLWGWRVISPTAPFTEGTAYSDEKWVKAIVLLTDGENYVNGGDSSTGFDKSVYNAFGFAKNGHLGNTNGSNAEATLDIKDARRVQRHQERRKPGQPHPALHHRLPGDEREPDPAQELRQQARHVLQLADQRSAGRHLPGHRAGLGRSAHRQIAAARGLSSAVGTAAWATAPRRRRLRPRLAPSTASTGPLSGWRRTNRDCRRP